MGPVKMLIPVKELRIYRARAAVPLECENCGIVFHKPTCDVLTSLKGNPQFALRFCSLKCHHAKRVKDTHAEVACEQCGKVVVKQTSWLKNNRHNFCSRSCSAKFQNAHKTLGKLRKSKAEIYLAELMRADFQGLLDEENVRGVLPSGLEQLCTFIQKSLHNSWIFISPEYLCKAGFRIIFWYSNKRKPSNLGVDRAA